MTTKYFALLTNQGAAKLANAAALGTKVDIASMAVGDGGGTLPTPDAAQTKLIGEKRRAPLNALAVDAANSSQIIAEQIIPESEGGFWIREIGLFDADGVLIAVANCAETYKPQLQEGSGRTQTVRMILIVNSTAAVTLKIDPSVVLATRKYVDDAVIEVKQYADNLMNEHLEEDNPHTQYLLIASAFKELKDGRLVAQALANLGLKAAAQRDVGTGVSQIPDISAFTGGLMTKGWAKIPLADGTSLIVQAGSYSSSDASVASYKLNFPIAFPKSCAALVLTAWQGSNGANYGHTGRNATGATVTRSSTSVPFYFDWIAVGE